MSAHVTVKQEVYSALRLATERYRHAAEEIDEIVGDSDQEEFHRLVVAELEHLGELYKAGRTEKVESHDPTIRVGDTVRILPSYAVVTGGEGEVGKEFTVTQVVSAVFGSSSFYVEGDPRGWGIWGEYVKKVQA